MPSTTLLNRPLNNLVFLTLWVLFFAGFKSVGGWGFSDMALLAEIHGVEACICPIGDRFTMGGKVAALAMTRFVKPKVAIPAHYGTFPIIDQNADAFVAGMQGSGIEVVLPKKGEAFAI